jgi:hypothetical protein
MDGVSDYQNMITYCVFTIDKNTNLLKLKPVKQVLIAFEMGFNIQQIYGINDALEENKNDLDFLAGGVGEEQSTND